MSLSLGIAFYNLDNLFDPFEAEHTLDFDYTPRGKKKWGSYRYNQKLYKISKTLSSIHKESELVFAGLAEIETAQVCQDLIEQEALQELNLDYVHYKSNDPRGINNALVYNKDYFELVKSVSHPVFIQAHGERFFSRDILEVRGKLNNEEITILINHWPSHRRRLNRQLRLQAKTVLEKCIRSIENENKYIIIMGDFNDNPDSEYLEFLTKEGYQNTLAPHLNANQGSTKHLRHWLLYDQIFLNNKFYDLRSSWKFESSRIYNEEFLKDPSGRNKNQPFRTFIGKNYIGGQSDHFPVLTTIKKT